MKQVRSVTLRPASAADSDLLLAWRNDPLTRRGSRHMGLVPLDEHNAWLTRVLQSPDQVIRIAEAGGEPVGVVRAARSGGEWELSWTVAPLARGRGVGASMLMVFVAGLAGRLTATIRKDNLASAKIAAAAGLKLAGDASDPDFGLWTRE